MKLSKTTGGRMTITKTMSSNKAKAYSYADANLSSDNILPYWWYIIIKSDSTKHNLITITTISELWFLHCKHVRIKFSENYAYFKHKFGFTSSVLSDHFKIIPCSTAIRLLSLKN